MYTSPHLVDIRERWLIDGELIAERAVRRVDRRAAVAPPIEIGISADVLRSADRHRLHRLPRADAKWPCSKSGWADGSTRRTSSSPIAARHHPDRPRSHRIPRQHDPEDRDRESGRHSSRRRGADVKSRSGRAVGAGEDAPRVWSGQRLSQIRGDRRRTFRWPATFSARTFRLQSAPRKSCAQSFRASRKSRSPAEWRDTLAGKAGHRLLAGKEIWVDGCHDLHAARAIAPFVEKNLRRPRLLVFGIMSDKDVLGGVTSLLFPNATRSSSPIRLHRGAAAADISGDGARARRAREARRSGQGDGEGARLRRAGTCSSPDRSTSRARPSRTRQEDTQAEEVTKRSMRR